MAYRPPLLDERAFWFAVENELRGLNAPQQVIDAIIRNLRDDFERAFEVGEDIILEQLYIPERTKGITLDLLRPHKILTDIYKTFRSHFTREIQTYFSEDRLVWGRLFDKVWVDEEGNPVFSADFRKAIGRWVKGSDNRTPRMLAEQSLEGKKKGKEEIPGGMDKEWKFVHAKQMAQLVGPDLEHRLNDLYYVKEALPVLAEEGFWGVGSQPLGQINKEIGDVLERHKELDQKLRQNLILARDLSAQPTLSLAQRAELAKAQGEVRSLRTQITQNLQDWQKKNPQLIQETRQTYRALPSEGPGSVTRRTLGAQAQFYERTKAKQLGALISPDAERKLTDLYFIRHAAQVLEEAKVPGLLGRPLADISSETASVVGDVEGKRTALLDTLATIRDLSAKPSLSPAEQKTLASAQEKARALKAQIDQSLDAWLAKNSPLIPATLKAPRSIRKAGLRRALQTRIQTYEEEREKADQKTRKQADFEEGLRKKYEKPEEFLKHLEELKKEGIWEIGGRPIDEVILEAQAAQSAIAAAAPDQREALFLSWIGQSEGARKEAVFLELEGEAKKREEAREKRALERAEEIAKAQKQFENLYRYRKLRYQTQNFLTEWDKHGLIPALVDRGWGALKLEVFGKKPFKRHLVQGKDAVGNTTESNASFKARLAAENRRYNLARLRYWAYPPNAIEALAEGLSKRLGLKRRVLSLRDLQLEIQDRAGDFAKKATKAFLKRAGKAFEKYAPKVVSKAAIVLKAQIEKISARLAAAAGSTVAGPVGAVLGGIAGFFVGKIIRHAGGLLKIAAYVGGTALLLFFGFIFFIAFLGAIMIASIFGTGGAGGGGLPGMPSPGADVSLTKLACAPPADCSNPANFQNPLRVANGTLDVTWRIVVKNIGTEVLTGTSLSDDRCYPAAITFGDLAPGAEEEVSCTTSERGTDEVVNNIATFSSVSPSARSETVGSLIFGNPPAAPPCGSPSGGAITSRFLETDVPGRGDNLCGVDPVSGIYRHNGLDIATGFGTPLRSTLQGTVTHMGAGSNCGPWPGSWYCIVVSNGVWSILYGHVEPSFPPGIFVGANVTYGQVIAYEDSTGFVTGPHVHYMVWEGPGSTYLPSCGVGASTALGCCANPLRNPENYLSCTP